MWTIACKLGFKALKKVFINTLILKLFNQIKDIVVKTNSSDYISTSIMSQYNNKGVLYPVIFFSKKLLVTKCNYKIYNKELLTIFYYFKEQRPELEGTPLLINVITNYYNLEYFISTKLLNR